MANYWKIGAVSGFIANLFTGVILSPILNQISVSMELWEPWMNPVVGKGIPLIIPISIVFGIILGVIYAKAYPAIPGKGALKGLCWGLILYVIIAVRIDTFWLAYGFTLPELFTWLPIILWGLITGILYEFLCSKYCPIKDLKIQKYSLLSGFYPGAIAGFCGGLAASIAAVIGPGMGLWEVAAGTVEITFDYWWGIAGSHIFINLFWGTIFGLMFTRVYDLVPGKGKAKGFVYGLTIYLITSVQLGVYMAIMCAYAEAWMMVISWIAAMFVVGALNGFVFAIVLGLLYRRPTDTLIVKEKIVPAEIAERCQHCGASIPKGSAFCNICGRKQ